MPGYASAMVDFRLLPGDTIADAQRHIERLALHARADFGSFQVPPMHANHEDLARFHGTNERISLEAYGDMIRFYYRLAQNTAR